MAIPNKFKPGEIASSAELNQNFTYIETLIGALSNEEEMAPEKDIKMGSAGLLNGGRQVNLLRGNRQTENITNNARGFINVTWNARPNASTGRWQRLNALSGSSVVELGDYGIVMATTSRTTGDLQSQLTPLLGAMNGDYDDLDAYHIYMDPQAPIKTTYKNPNNPKDESNWRAKDVHQSFQNSLQRRRLTYVRFDEPKTIMEEKSMPKGTQEINLLSHGLPKEAAMVELLVYVTATYNSGAGLFLMPKLKQTHRKYGLICHAYGGSSAGWGRSAVQGNVPVYKGVYKLEDGTYTETDIDEGGEESSLLVLEATASFHEVSIYMQGYYV